jgi:hypothetical protein
MVAAMHRHAGSSPVWTGPLHLQITQMSDQKAHCEAAHRKHIGQWALGQVADPCSSGTLHTRIHHC